MTDANITSGAVEPARITISREEFALMLLWDKINSVQAGATRGPFDYIKKADSARKVVGSATAQELVRFNVNQPEWRESGVIELDLTGHYTNAGSGAYRATFFVDISPMPPTSNPADPNFGQLQAWTNVVLFLTNDISVIAGNNAWRARVELHAESLVGAAWTQTAHGRFARGDASTSPQTAVVQDALWITTIDPSDSFMMRVRFSATVGASQAFDSYSARAGVRNRRDGA